MHPKRSPSDSGLILGALFVACTVGCIGLVADQNVARQTVAMYRDALAAAAGSTAATTGKQLCLPKSETGQASVKTSCVDGCHYIATAGSFPARATVTATSQYSDGTKNPGTVKFTAYGASSLTSLTCKGGAGSTLGDATGPNMPSGLPGLANLVGNEPNTMNIVQPAAAAPSVSSAVSGASNPGITSASTYSNSGAFGELPPGISPAANAPNTLNTQYQYVCTGSGCTTYQYIGAAGGTAPSAISPGGSAALGGSGTNNSETTADIDGSTIVPLSKPLESSGPGTITVDADGMIMQQPDSAVVSLNAEDVQVPASPVAGGPATEVVPSTVSPPPTPTPAAVPAPTTGAPTGGASSATQASTFSLPPGYTYQRVTTEMPNALYPGQVIPNQNGVVIPPSTSSTLGCRTLFGLKTC